MAPEGTRNYRPYWRSGFYHIALAAQVPVGCVYFDFAKKEVGLLDFVEITGDVRADMAQIRTILGGHLGYLPEKAAPIALQCEEEKNDAQSAERK
jgi:hypothetical protein